MAVAKVFTIHSNHRITLNCVKQYPGGSSEIDHRLLFDKAYPSDPLDTGDSSNPLFFLAPDNELILVGTNLTANRAPILGFFVDEINEIIQSQAPIGFGLDQQVDVYDLRTPIPIP